MYNGETYLVEAIDSVLGQTYGHFELIIIEDGSKDGSYDVLQRFTDSRVKVIRQANMGLAATLNKGIGLAAGKYIARQDQDDISFPTRFEKQVRFLNDHPDYGMVGTRAEIWMGNRRTGRVHRHPTENHILKFDLLINNPFVHSSVMIRKTALEKVGLYSTDPARQPPEDYELWSRVARDFKVANLPEILHVYREVPKSMSRITANPFLEKIVRISSENISWYLGKRNPEPEIIKLAEYFHLAPATALAKPDFAGMRQILMGAAAKIAGNDVELSALEKKAAKLTAKPGWWHPVRKYAGGWIRRAKNVIGSITRRPDL